MRTNHFSKDARVLILTPTARDADVTVQILNQENINVFVCQNLTQLCEEIEIGADVALLPEEAILADRLGSLKQVLEKQASWSDFPLIVLTANLNSAFTATAEIMQSVGNMTLISRPLHILTLLSTVRAALRDRKRQYLIRDALIERERQTDALQASEKQFRDMANSIDQMIWVTRPDGYHEYYNRRWYDYTGVTAYSTDGTGWNGIFHPDDQERAWKRWSHSLKTGKAYEIEYRLRRHDGVYRWVLGRAECVRDEHGRITKWYGTCTDIQDLVDAREQSEAANVAKTEFLANMSHEIRTPMNAVIGLAHILARSAPLSEQQREFIKTLQMSADSLLFLINDLLDVAKIEARSVHLEEIPFSLEKLIHEIVNMLAIRAREKNLSFTYDASLVRDQIYVGDPTRIRQIVLNLCSNAIKFTENGSVHISVHAENAQDSALTQVCLTVTDTGIGIPPGQVETIFQKFTQADSSINRKYGGTGLGLAITKSLVEIMDGTIAVESVIDQGSRFTVCLPLRTMLDNMTDSSLIAHENRHEQEHRERQVVLLVEDHEPNILVATTYLEIFGFGFQIARDGMEAVEKSKSTNFAAILMDVQMSGLNGFDATRLIRAYEIEVKKPSVPIIGMTAHAFSGDKERCLEVGMNDYLSKPFDPDELKTKLNEFMKISSCQ